MTEEELTQRLKEGDNAARKALYERFAGALLSLCQRYVGNREEAEDVLHDGFIQVFTSGIQHFTWRGNGSLKAWLYRVFANFSLNHLEAAKRLQMQDTESFPDTPDDEEQPVSIDMNVLHDLIAQLPPGYRTVINLYLLEGWSHAEIAKRLNITESTSASQYLRGKKLLKEKILQYFKQQEQ